MAATGDPAKPNWQVRLMAPAVRSMAWQALGSASTLACAAWVSLYVGIGAQGQFALIKSWFDAAIVLAALGLPQGLLHLQYRLKFSGYQICRQLAPWVAGAGGSCVVSGVVMLALGWPQTAALLIALPFGVVHLLARSVVLVERGAVFFGFITALPAMLLLLALLAWTLGGQVQHFEWPLLASTVLAGLWASMQAWRAARRTEQRAELPWPGRELWSVCAQSWWQMAFGSLLGAGLLSTVAVLGGESVAVGEASLGIYVYQLFAMLTGYLAPLLYDHFARQSTPTLRGWPRPARLGAALAVAVALLGLAASALRPDWARWLMPMSLMTLAGIAAVAARVTGTVLLARGDYLELSAQAAWRLALAMFVAAVALPLLPSAAAVALALLIIESATWWRSAQRLKKGPP